MPTLPPTSFELVEPLTLNAWPALQQFVVGGWLLRMSEGYTKRANSVQPLWQAKDAADISEKIAWCEDVYDKAGLPAIFKITPYSAPTHLDQLLAKAGYRVEDPSCVKARSLEHLPLSSGRLAAFVEPTWTEEWFSTMSVWTSLRENQRATAKRLLDACYPQKAFFTLMENNVPVALGMGAIERGFVGLYDIVTAPNRRNEGFGEQLILHILRWAKELGAHSSYLQVVRANAAANRLYDKLGYEELYPYWYRVQRT